MLANITLGFVSRLCRGRITFDAQTQLLAEDPRSLDHYVDAGIICLTPQDAAKVTGWTNNTWYVLPDELTYEELFLNRPVDGRVYFVTGFCPHAPNAFFRNEQRKQISYTFLTYAMCRSEQQSVQGVFSFAVESETWTFVRTDEEGQQTTIAQPQHRLSGLSGAPVWTFDFLGQLERDLASSISLCLQREGIDRSLGEPAHQPSIAPKSYLVRTGMA